MKNNLHDPCSECPFKKTSARGWLGGLTATETYHGVMTQEMDFACHKTRSKRSPDDMSRCRGSLLFLKKNCKLPRYNAELGKAVASLKNADTDSILLGHDFIKHHTL